MSRTRVSTATIAAIAVCVAAGAAYAWAARSGGTHGYYTPAAVSMSEGIRAFLYGAYDTAGFAGIDKMPGALWPQALSVAVFGYSDGSILVPQAVASAATAWVLFLAVGRWLGRPTGLAAAAAYALTPLVAALAHSNVPEPWLALWLAVSAYLAIRAVQSPRRGAWWLAAAGVAVGAAFTVKMLEAWVMVPAILIPYVIAARPRALVRVLHAGIAVAATLVASLWWVVLVSLTPAADRPWVGGSNGDSAWEMVFGYNGLGRFGLSTGRSFVADFAGPAGLSRLLGAQVSVDVMWLVPLAAVSLVVGLVVTARRPRIDLERAGYLLFGLWLVPSVLALAFASGIHTFYVLLFAAPAVALAAAGARQGLRWLDSGRRWPLLLGIVLQAAWSGLLVLRAGDRSWLAVVVAVLAVAAVVAVLVHARVATIALASLMVLAAPAAWTVSALGPVDTINPTASSAVSGPGGGGPGGGAPGDGGPGGSGRPSGPPPGGMPGGPGGAGAGSPGGSAAPSTELATWLADHGVGDASWVAADSRAAGSLVLAGLPGVMAMGGGFDGSDPTPTVAELQALVTAGQVRYVLLGSDMGAGTPGGMAEGPGGSGPSLSGTGAASTLRSERSAWVEQSCTAVTDAPASGGTLYDCAPSSGS